ncbi:hypothetical protein JAN5088_00721 [Jannaschia rubra]|uniref:Uncharacterized protein n=1 Tax=Jannaschia rubra TaxID=282197 RepID=A0A0M6XMS3_9RHOB|nr:hypothetical protein JAN5088_00721 [Jannaschia rubra]SFG41090.1 hypothetical protein SAMN04488517_104275 [Jannaschia rubra]
MNTAPSAAISVVAVAGSPERNGGSSARKKIDSLGFSTLMSVPHQPTRTSDPVPRSARTARAPVWRSAPHAIQSR